MIQKKVLFTSIMTVGDRLVFRGQLVEDPLNKVHQRIRGFPPLLVDLRLFEVPFTEGDCSILPAHFTLFATIMQARAPLSICNACRARDTCCNKVDSVQTLLVL